MGARITRALARQPLVYVILNAKGGNYFLHVSLYLLKKTSRIGQKLIEKTAPNTLRCKFFSHIRTKNETGAEEPEAGLDPKCYRANGFFNHEDPKVCNK
jgi:hypothetical protein